MDDYEDEDPISRSVGQTVYYGSIRDLVEMLGGYAESVSAEEFHIEDAGIKITASGDTVKIEPIPDSQERATNRGEVE